MAFYCSMEAKCVNTKKMVNNQLSGALELMKYRPLIQAQTCISKNSKKQ